MINIMVVDDQVLFRDALVKLINSQPDMKVTSAISEAKDALALCEKTMPDLVLLDVLTNPVPFDVHAEVSPTGISVAAQLRQQFPGVKVIIMTGLSEISLSEAARKAGAHSFISKNIHGEEFLGVIRNTMTGCNTFPEKPPQGLPFLASFSEREIRVLRLFCRGETRSEVAEELGVSEALVKAIVTNLLNKTGFDSILRLAVYLTSSDYILPGIGE